MTIFPGYSIAAESHFGTHRRRARPFVFARDWTVWTTFVDSNEPTSIANEFKLDVVSNDPPRMPEEEYRRRAEGKP